MKWMGAFLFLVFGVGAAQADDPATYEAQPDLINVAGYVIYFNAQGPTSYLTSTAHDLPPGVVSLGEVHSEVCQHGLALPVTANLKDRSGKVGGALGNGGYRKAVERLKDQYPEIQGLYDVQIDLHQIRILSIYSKLCTTLTGRGFKY